MKNTLSYFVFFLLLILLISLMILGYYAGRRIGLEEAKRSTQKQETTINNHI